MLLLIFQIIEKATKLEIPYKEDGSLHSIHIKKDHAFDKVVKMFVLFLYVKVVQSL